MSYTVFVFFLWLTHGTPNITITFTPWALSFIVAILLDLFLYKPWTKIP